MRGMGGTRGMLNHVRSCGWMPGMPSDLAAVTSACCYCLNWLVVCLSAECLLLLTDVRGRDLSLGGREVGGSTSN